MKNKHWILGALVLLGSGSNGCFLMAAGVAEASRSEAHQDLMGKEYESPEGDIGWYNTYSKPSAAKTNLRKGLVARGCTVKVSDEKVKAKCPDGLRLTTLQSEDRIYRLCSPKTERLACRSAWDKVHAAAPAKFEGEVE